MDEMIAILNKLPQEEKEKALSLLGTLTMKWYNVGFADGATASWLGNK